MEPELEAITDEILATIAREVPEYARPLEGSFGRGVRTGVSEALQPVRRAGPEPLGRARARARGLRGARPRRAAPGSHARLAPVRLPGRRAGGLAPGRRRRRAAPGFEAEPLSLLAESMFAYIEELSADSVEGYAEARSRQEGERRRRQRELAAAPAARPARRRGRPARRRGRRRLAPAALGRRPGLPRGRARAPRAPPARRRAVSRAPRGRLRDRARPRRPRPGREHRAGPRRRAHAALGPTVALAELASSWSLARAALRRGRRADGGVLVRADDVLVELLLHDGRGSSSGWPRAGSAPLEELTPKARARMQETALAYVREHGNAAAMARSLGLHPQTVRYRLARCASCSATSSTTPTRASSWSWRSALRRGCRAAPCRRRRTSRRSRRRAPR